MNQFVETDHIRFEIIDGILIATHKPSVITLDIAKDIVNTRHEFIKGISYHSLVKDSKLAKIEKPARDYFSTEESYAGIKSIAFLTPSIFTVTLVNFFMRFQKTPFPVKSFRNETDAIKWLKSLDQ